MANNEIHNYQVERTVVKDTDWLDIDADNGSFDSEKLGVGTLKKHVLEVTPQPVQTLFPLGGVATMNLNNNNYFILTLTADTTLEFSSAPASGFRGTFVVQCTQDVTGGHTLTGGTNVIPYDGVADINTGGSEKFDIYLFWDGTDLMYNILNR